MGKYRGPLRISGSICDITFCKDGTARMKSTLSKEKWKNRKTFKNSRVSAISFGGASACAGNLIKVLPPEMRRLARRHAHNAIATRLRAAAPPDLEGIQRYTFEDALAALHQLDLSKSVEHAAKVRIRTLGHPLQPRGIHIQGLNDLADAIRKQHAASDSQRLQFRFHFSFARFVEVYLHDGRKWRDASFPDSHDQPPTAWMDADLLPSEGAAISLTNPDPTTPHVVMVGIEWRTTEPHATAHTPRSRKPNPANSGKPKVSTAARSITRTNSANPDHSAKREFSKANPDHPENSDNSANSDSGSLLRIAALYRPVADLHLPVPAYMQGTGNRRFRLQPGRRRRHPRMELSQTLRLRLSFPMQGVVGAGKIAPSNVGWAPELLRRPRPAIRKDAPKPMPPAHAKAKKAPAIPPKPVTIQQVAPVATPIEKQTTQLPRSVGRQAWARRSSGGVHPNTTLNAHISHIKPTSDSFHTQIERQPDPDHGAVPPE